MKVSVIIPGYRSQYVLESIQSCFDQVKQPHEILFDYCKELMPADKINKLAGIATGDALMILSDDDLIDKKFIDITSATMKEYALDIVYTDMEYFGDRTGIQPGNPFTLEVLRQTTAPWMTSLIRKSLFDELGGWDPDQDYQDWDFYFRAFKAGATAYCIHEPLFKYRVHNQSGSLSMNHELSRNKMREKHPEVI